MATLEENRFWDRYDWPRNGDEWTDQAEFSGIDYATWKQDIVDAFILPNVAEGSTVLEIAVGHGRWVAFLAERAKRYIGIDFSPSCIAFCRERFAHLDKAHFCISDGRTIPFIPSSSVQFVWSYDSFVHIEPDITEGYLSEFARVLSPGGRCSIHHPGKPSPQQRADGGRSQLSSETFARLASAHGLRLLSQEDSWGPGNRSNTKLFADCISTIEKPASSS